MIPHKHLYVSVLQFMQNYSILMEIFPEVTSIVNDLIYFSSLTVYHGNIIFHLIIFNGLPNVSSIVSTNVEARCTPYRM